jgi:hypothetical protein
MRQAKQAHAKSGRQRCRHLLGVPSLILLRYKNITDCRGRGVEAEG